MKSQPAVRDRGVRNTQAQVRHGAPGAYRHAPALSMVRARSRSVDRERAPGTRSTGCPVGYMQRQVLRADSWRSALVYRLTAPWRSYSNGSSTVGRRRPTPDVGPRAVPLTGLPTMHMRNPDTFG